MLLTDGMLDIENVMQGGADEVFKAFQVPRRIAYIQSISGSNRCRRKLYDNEVVFSLNARNLHLVIGSLQYVGQSLAVGKAVFVHIENSIENEGRRIR